MPETAEKKPDALVPLKDEDRRRMGRLFEEITGKVQEMSSIMNRLHGTPLRWSNISVSPSGA